MNRLPGVSEVMALLEALRNHIRDFGAREEKPTQEFRQRLAIASRQFEGQIQTAEAKLQTGLAEATALFTARREGLTARFDARKRCINEAHKRARKGAGEAISKLEGRRKHKLQENAIAAERRRDAGLAQATTANQQFNADLAAEQNAIEQLAAESHKASRAYFGLPRPVEIQTFRPEPDRQGDEYEALNELRNLRDKTAKETARLKKQPTTVIFRFIPLWVIGPLLVAVALTVPFLRSHRILTLNPSVATWAWIMLGILVTLYVIGRVMAGELIKPINRDLSELRRLLKYCAERSASRFASEQERIHAEFEATHQQLDLDYKKAVKEAIGLRDLRPREIDEQAHRVHQKSEESRRKALGALEAEETSRVHSLKAESLGALREMKSRREVALAALEAEQKKQFVALEQEWREATDPIFAALKAAETDAKPLTLPWNQTDWEKWEPRLDFKNVAQFGSLKVDLEKLAQDLPPDSRLRNSHGSSLNVPLLLTYPNEGSMLFETEATGSAEAVSSLNNIIFRLLTAIPPGKASFTIIDPVGLGQNFAGLMHLADFEQSNINSRIWTQMAQIEEKLGELNEHMEKVIQMYLRNEYATIAEYNARAGAIAEKYHFVVVASFPVNFSDTAARRLRNIATSGARCGVYSLIQWDKRNAIPQDFVPDELRDKSVRLIASPGGFNLAQAVPGTRVELDAPPDPEVATQFLKRVGQAGRNANRVEVPFSEIAPKPEEIWSEETSEELRVPIGRTGATKLQCLAIGKGTRQHALIAGKTGSGKSTLFHVIITNLALWCSPEQVEFYLLDFKKGVEFKCYATHRLPHARVVAIESDRQFGLSVLERVDAELRKRGDMFRKLGVQDLAGYKRAGGKEVLPRSLLLIDEFQEFFVEDDRVSQGAAMLLDRIVRQGRAFGIHVILGSQTLGGAYTLARATLGQMVIRVALQCNEADAFLIMDQDNPAPRLLSRPGEGIYNDAAGAIEGNSPFQVVWLNEDERDDRLADIRKRAGNASGKFKGPFVFEGNAPAEVEENDVLNEALTKGLPEFPPPESRIWLGTPNSIKGPTEVVFRPQGGSHLLIVGQNEEAAVVLLAGSMIALSAQYPPHSIRLVLLDSTPPGSPAREFLDRITAMLPQNVMKPTQAEMPEVLEQLSAELEEGTEPRQPAFLLVNGLENFKKLKQEDEFAFGSTESKGPNAAAAFLKIISDGPAHGFHLIVSCDTFNTVSRFLGRKSLSEFSMRVLFQMSASDSAALIDAPDAGTLGMHRALLYNDREGYIETFRPYARPGNDWLERAAAQLRNTDVKV